MNLIQLTNLLGILAQIDIGDSVNSLLTIIKYIAIILCAISTIFGGYKLSTGETEAALRILLGGWIIGGAIGVLVPALFAAGGTDLPPL